MIAIKVFKLGLFSHLIFFTYFSLPRPTSGTIIGGCGTIYAATIGMRIPPWPAGSLWYSSFGRSIPWRTAFGKSPPAKQKGPARRSWSDGTPSGSAGGARCCGPTAESCPGSVLSYPKKVRLHMNIMDQKLKNPVQTVQLWPEKIRTTGWKRNNCT